MIDNVPVILKDMSSHVRGFVCLGADYEPVIVLNSRLSVEQQRKAYLHEINHIDSDDLTDDDYDEYGDWK